MSGEPARECRHCGTDYKPEYNDCPNCGTGFFMPPVSGDRACEDCGERFAEEEYECPDCGSSFVSTA